MCSLVWPSLDFVANIASHANEVAAAYDTPPGIAEGLRALEVALVEFKGCIAVVSSFGADSAVLLALVVEIDRTTPVLFIETGKHFAETLAYREQLLRFLGL